MLGDDVEERVGDAVAVADGDELARGVVLFPSDAVDEREAAEDAESDAVGVDDPLRALDVEDEGVAVDVWERAGEALAVTHPVV